MSRRLLESIQDIIVIGLVIVLFALMVRTLWRIAQDVTAPQLDFRFIISEVLFMLVMVELVRLLVVYLRDHHVAVDFMVELGIVSTLREVVLRGVVELEWQEIIAVALFLLALGLLLRFGDLRIPVPVPGERDPAESGRSESLSDLGTMRRVSGAG
jgi:uncharacterized membrane protein (DUF373 family)